MPRRNASSVPAPSIAPSGIHDSEVTDDSIRTLSSFSFPAAFSLARSLDARGSPTGTPHPRWPEAAAPAGRAGTRAIPLSPAAAPRLSRREGRGGRAGDHRWGGIQGPGGRGGVAAEEDSDPAGG